MQTHIAFTDGAAKGNPGPGGWGAVVVTLDGHVTELGGGSPHTTNNKMELGGAIAALTHLAEMPGTVTVYTDSTYVIQGITKWLHGWRARGWKTATGQDVLNRDLWEQLSSLVQARGKGGVAWHWVRGHVGTPGNERADAISVAYALQRPAGLYAGPLSGYEVDVLSVPDGDGKPAERKPGAAKSKAAAYSYLSVVDGVPMRHATWSECERRVKGRSNARFKKSASAADELAILRAWGVDPSGL